ncbi:MAG: hypothetical protein QM576_10835 [Rhodopseudomonas sp.]|uniref:hypothetical protein n=1 Tax=Rhodopseudomonas sp. TaxID=1078 RepID=UPI0039E6AD43
MTLIARIFQHRLLRVSRQAIAMTVLAVYLLAGAVHGLCDLDITTGSATAIVSLPSHGGDHSDNIIAGDHHCHGCFSVSLPSPSVVATAAELATAPMHYEDAERRSVQRGIEPPPPKALI